MKAFFALLLFAAVILCGPAAFAEGAAKQPHRSILIASEVYAFPGKKCPSGSHIYQGPEADLIKKDDAVYCVFDRQYVPIPAKESKGQCPEGKPYTAPDFNPAVTGIIWCPRPGATLGLPRS